MQTDKHLKFETIYNDYRERIFAFICVAVKNETDRWDVFQEIFSKLFEKIESLDEQLNIKSYIYTVAKNKINDYFRKNQKHFYTANITENEEFALTKENTADMEIKTDIKSAFKHLTNREKEVFEYKYFFDYKISEIAEKTGLSEGAVKRYLFDATLKLKERLK